MGCASSTAAECAEYLKDTPFFIHMSIPDLLAFGSFFTIRLLPPNSCLFREGELGSAFYVVGKGTIHVSAKDSKGVDKYLVSKSAGDFFGETALQMQKGQQIQRTATVKTSTLSVTLLVLELKNWIRFCKAHPSLKSVVEKITTQRMTSKLKNIPFLSSLSENKLELLGELFRYETHEVNEIIFREGEIGSSFYLVSHGTVAVTSKGPNGEDVKLREVLPGQAFGEISLMVDMPRTATIVAQERVLLLSLEKDNFQNFLKVVPDLKTRFEKMVKQRTVADFKRYNIPFFAGIPQDKFALLADYCTIENLPPNKVIFAEGDLADTFHIIIHGEVDVSVNKDGTNITLNRMGSGSYFGEIALVKETPRTATVTTVDRCVILTITKDNFREFFAEMPPEALVDFEVKLAKYHVELEHLIKHSLGVEFFRKYLQTEFSAENLDFWLEAKRYSESPEGTDIVPQAQKIFYKFISPDADTQVNINGELVQKISDDMKEGNITREVFQDAQREVFKLMDKDSFGRFKQSKLFQEFLEAIGSYQVDPNQIKIQEKYATKIRQFSQIQTADHDEVKLDGLAQNSGSTIMEDS